MLTFVIPVRHQATVRDWTVVKSNLATTVRSLAAQTSALWKAIIVANEGADLPSLPARFEVVRVDIPPNALPYHKPHTEEFYEAIRIDKGSRVLHGLVRGQAAGHVMVVDYDDLVSNRLAEFAAAAPDANGWFVNAGYIFSGGTEVLHYDSSFHKFCGTSHLVRADLLQLPGRVEDAADAYIRRWLGSHVFIAGDLEYQGTPLAPLPFTGAVYRVGNAEAVIGSPGLQDFIKQRSGGDVEAHARLMSKLSAMTQALADEFFAGEVR